MDLKTTFRLRKKSGATLTEFGASFVILVIFLFIPLVNLSFIFVRYFAASAAIAEYTHRLSLAEKRSAALSMLSTDTWWSQFADRWGVNVTNKRLSLVICGASEADKLTVNGAADVPADWLPGGTRGPCIYTVNLEVDVEISPVFSGGTGVPGITSAVPMKITGHSNWENLSRDPKTTRFFINE